MGQRACITAAMIIVSLAADARARPGNAFDLPLAPARFAWSSPLAQRNDLYAVRGTADGSLIWAVGAAGTVLSLRGATAVLETTGTDLDLYNLWVVAENDVWVVGERGTILHGDGKTWSRVRSGTKQALYSIWGRDAQDLWIGGNGGTVLRRERDRWRVVPVATKGPIASIGGCDRAAVCALTLASTLPAIDLSNRPCADPDGECLADEPQEPEGDRILRWSDRRWSTIFLNGGVQPQRMVSAGTTQWLTDDNLLRIVRSGKLDDVPVVLPTDADMIRLNGLSARDDKDGWLVGERCTQKRPTADYRCDRGAIWRFDGRAASLRKEEPPTPLSAVWAWTRNGAIAVGERGTVVRFDGDAWTTVSKPLTDVDVRGVWSVPAPPDRSRRGAIALRARDNENEAKPRTVELAMTEGRELGWGLLKAGGVVPPPTSTEADTWLIGDCEALRARGRGWITYFPPSCEPASATRRILGFDIGDAWIAAGYSGSSGPYSPVHWNGRAWSNVRSPSGHTPVDLWGSKADDVWFVGGRDVARWDGHALTAAPPVPGLDPTDELTAVWGSDAKNVWVAAYGGDTVKVSRWDGAGWQAAASFRFDLPRRLQPVDLWATSNLWPPAYVDSRLVALWGTSADDVWLAGPRGVVIRFDGRRWQRVATPTRYPLFGLGGTSDRVFAVGATGTILELDRTATK